MATLDEVAEFRTALDDLSTLAIRDSKAVLLELSAEDPVAVRNGLIATLPEVVGPYLSAAGDLAATWYEDLRSAAVGGQFYATSDAAVNAAQISALSRYAVKPLFGQSQSSVLSLLGGGVQKLVAGASRDTIDANVLRDPVRVGYARIPRPGCCAFCGLLASRGAIYRSSGSAGGALGKKYHNFCRCVTTPVFQGGDNSAVQATVDEFAALYAETDGVVTKADGTRSTNLKATLTSWRQIHGSR
jgi:hypothetical protein